MKLLGYVANNNKISILLLIIYFISAFAFVKAQQQLPALDLTPQSPTTEAFSRYGDIPVDISTGVPNINIPIYTLKSGNINVPISISYHASGIKLQDIASEVGLGWVLNSGGIVTRTVLGQPDEGLGSSTSKPYYGNAAQMEQALIDGNNGSVEQQQYLSQSIYYGAMNKESYDYFSDRYYYSLSNGQSGIFRKDFSNAALIMVPYSTNKARFYYESSSNLTIENLRIEITTSDGASYFFKRYTSDLWGLTKIVNSNKTDSVLFYSHKEQYQTYSKVDNAHFGDEWTSNGLQYSDRTEVEQESGGFCLAQKFGTSILPRSITSTNDIVLLDSIVSTTAIVKFIYLSDRQDRQFTTFDNPKSRLNKIQVVSKVTGQAIKEFSFYQSYFGTSGSADARLRLDSISIGEEKYSFKYNSLSLPAYYHLTFQGEEGSTSEDFWGYYNGSGGIGSVPGVFLPDQFAGVNKFPDEYFSKACILQEIKYPAGGKTTFEFELNKVGFNVYDFTASGKPSDGSVGGLRLKKITTYSNEDAQPIVKQYEYVPRTSTYYPINRALFVYREDTYNLFAKSPSCQSDYFSGSWVCVSNPLSKIIGIGGAPVTYPQITEYYGNASVNLGKTVYYYSVPEADNSISDYRFRNPFEYDNGNYIPQLIKKEIYINDNGVYRLIKSIENTYTEFKPRSFQTGLNLASNLNFASYNGGLESTAFDTYNLRYAQDCISCNYLNTMEYSDTWASTNINLVTRAKESDFINESTIVNKTTDFDYDEYLQLAKKTVSNSSGETFIYLYKYSTDFPSQSPYSEMLSRNILAPVIEQAEYKNTITSPPLQILKTNYDYWNGSAWSSTTTNMIVPRTLETQKDNDLPETRLRYEHYDNQGNVQSVSKEGGPKTCYVWSYGGQYLIAKIENADYSAVESALSGSVAVQSFRDNLSPTDAQVVSFLSPLRNPNNPALKGALVTTFTYDPLVGMTSMTDPAGHITYYQYDPFQRLQAVKDQPGNIIKSYDYHYKP